LSKGWDINKAVIKKENLAEDALKVAGFWLAGQAKRLTPTITARLKNSISSAVKGGSPQGANDGSGEKADSSELVPIPDKKLFAWVGSSVVYAPYVEFGTTRQKEQSYLRRALQENKKQLLKILAGRMRK